MRPRLTLFLVIISAFSTRGIDGYRRQPEIDILNYAFSVSVSNTIDIIYGETTISIRFNGTVDTIKFDLKNIRSDGKGMVTDSVRFSVGNITWYHKDNKIIVIPQDTVIKNTSGTLRIVYHGIPSD